MPKKILVVDDSPVMRVLILKALKQAGYIFESEEAGDGFEALKCFEKKQFELVLSDWNMPNMSGLEFVRELRKKKQFQGIPVIVISTETSPDKIKQIIDAGANGCVSKPITPIKLKVKLDSYFME